MKRRVGWQPMKKAVGWQPFKRDEEAASPSFRLTMKADQDLRDESQCSTLSLSTLEFIIHLQCFKRLNDI
jgi:hypothetical protein